MTCHCVDVATAVRCSLEGLALPQCSEHPDPEPATDLPPQIALNDDTRLAAQITRAFGEPVNLNREDTGTWT